MPEGSFLAPDSCCGYLFSIVFWGLVPITQPSEIIKT